MIDGSTNNSTQNIGYESLETERIRDEIGRCESIDDLKDIVFPMIISQRESWKYKINEIIERADCTRQEFASRCRVSRMTLNDWRNGSLPRDREKFIRIALAAGYGISETNRLLQRYGRFPELYPKSLEDCVCIYVINHYGTDSIKEYDRILEQIKGMIIRDDVIDGDDITTIRFKEKLSEVKEDDELERFISENASVFATEYNRLYSYIKACIESNYLDPEYANNIYDMSVVQKWSSSLKQCVSAINQRKWYPTRNKIISLGLHLSLDHEQIDKMLTLAHMEPLCAKNIFESIIMFILDDASLNDILNTDSEEYDPDELCEHAGKILSELDIPEVRAFISELPGQEDE